MRQLMRPLICSNVLALRLALVVGISFLACNTFSSKLILTSHESLTYFLSFSPTLSHLRFCFGSLSMLIFFILPTNELKSYPTKRTQSTHARQSPTHNSNLLMSPAICDDLFYPWQCAGLYGHPKHKTMDSLLHMRITISLFMSAATVTTIWYLRHPQTVLMCITMSLFAFYSYTHHRVMEG